MHYLRKANTVRNGSLNSVVYKLEKGSACISCILLWSKINHKTKAYGHSFFVYYLLSFHKMRLCRGTSLNGWTFLTSFPLKCQNIINIWFQNFHLQTNPEFASTAIKHSSYHACTATSGDLASVAYRKSFWLAISALFTSRKGIHSARVTLTRVSKIPRVYKQNLVGKVTLPHWDNLPSIANNISRFQGSGNL